MTRINVTELRKHFPAVLERVRTGQQVEVVRRGQVIALLVRPVEPREAARAQLQALRPLACVGEVESPNDVEWEAAGCGLKASGRLQ